MSGFGKITFKGEYANQPVVNVLHYRSTDWLPGGGNPFNDVLAFVDAVILTVKPKLINTLPSGYKLNDVEGVGYDDTYNIVTASPLVRTVNEFGTAGTGDTNGSAPCMIIGLRCGEQVQINNLGKSKRNRGYLAIGPTIDGAVDVYSHISGIQFALNELLAQAVASPVVVLLPPCTLTPIRIHEKWTTVLGAKVLLWRTYSDVLGYRINRVASYRRSRQPRE
jgi:hypothetical protein